MNTKEEMSCLLRNTTQALLEQEHKQWQDHPTTQRLFLLLLDQRQKNQEAAENNPTDALIVQRLAKAKTLKEIMDYVQNSKVFVDSVNRIK